MTFAHRKQAEKIRSDIQRYLDQGGHIQEVPAGFSGGRCSMANIANSERLAARARRNGQKARGRQKKGESHAGT